MITETPQPTMADIYLYTCKVNGCAYVGCTTRPWKQREDDHMRASRHHAKRHTKLNRDLRKYGRKAFVVEMLARVTYEEAGKIEAFYINHFDTLNTEHGYNRTTTDYPPHIQSLETKKRLRRLNLAKLRKMRKNAA